MNTALIRNVPFWELVHKDETMPFVLPKTAIPSSPPSTQATRVAPNAPKKSRASCRGVTQSPPIQLEDADNPSEVVIPSAKTSCQKETSPTEVSLLVSEEEEELPKPEEEELPKPEEEKLPKPEEEKPPKPEDGELPEVSPNESVEAVTAEELERTKTLKQLREMCLERNLSAAGKKGELARRLMA